MTPVEAVSAPRVDFQGDVVQTEARIPLVVTRGLETPGLPGQPPHAQLRLVLRAAAGDRVARRKAARRLRPAQGRRHGAGHGDGEIRRPGRARHGRRSWHRRGDRPALGAGGREGRGLRPGRGSGRGGRGAARRSRHRVRRDRSRPGRGDGRADGQGARAPRHPGHVRGHHPRQPAVQDDRRRLGRGHRHPPQGHVPLRAGGAEAHGRAEVRKDGVPVVDVGARQSRPGQLLGGQGGPAGHGAHARDRARAVQHQRQRGRARIRRDAHDAGDRRAHGRRLRGVQDRRGVADPAAPGRPAGGHRQRDRVPVQRRVELRLRPDHLRPGRP